MDRREFLWTSGAAALSPALPLSCAARAVAPIPAPVRSRRCRSWPAQLATPRSTNCSKPFSRSRFGRHRSRRLFSASTKASSRPLNPGSTRGPTSRRGSRRLARTNKFIGWLELLRSGSVPAAQLNREVVLWDLKTGNIGAGTVRHLQPAKPVCDQPAGRRLFLNPRCPQFRPHYRNRSRCRSLSFTPVAIRHRARQRDHRTATAGRPRLSRAGLVARSGARPDASAARAGRGAKHDGRFGLDASVDAAKLATLFDESYAREAFVRTPEKRLPEVVAVSGTNYVEVGLRSAPSTTASARSRASRQSTTSSRAAPVRPSNDEPRARPRRDGDTRRRGNWP